MAREAYRQAAQFFVQVVAQIPDDRWDFSGLGVWTVRDLVGHASRSLANVETYLAKPAERIDIPDPAAYFLLPAATFGGPTYVADRGRAAGQGLGGASASAVEKLAQRVLAGLDQVADVFLLSVPGGGMRLDDYLATRVLELTIHSLDIAAAIGLEVEAPPGPMGVTLRLLSDLAVRQGKGPAFAFAATGRGNLPDGFNLLG